MTDVSGEQIIPAPPYACEPVQLALQTLNQDLTAGDEHSMFENFMAAQCIASACGNLCASGCTRTEYLKAQEAGSTTPPTEEQELLFELVNEVLVMEALKEAEASNYAEVEDPGVTGSELKEIIEARLNIFNDPELIEKLAAHGGNDAAELKAALDDTLTPIADDYYEALAELVQGSVRAALYITAHVLDVAHAFRATDFDSQQRAQELRIRGVKPANPFMVTALEVEKLALRVDENRMVDLWQDATSCQTICLDDDGEEDTVHTRYKIDEIIDINPEKLPEPRDNKE